jgi:hypothetical protein
VITKCRIVSNVSTGIACSLSKPTVSETIIEDNQMIGISGSLGEITSCTIRGNGGGKPGHAGLAGCSGFVRDCTIRDNKGTGLAGCGGLLRRCVVSANSGDGLHNYVGEVKNCLITANLGDGLRFEESCGCNIGNCTIAGNAGNATSFRPRAKDGAAFTFLNSIVVLNGGFAVHREYMGVNVRWTLRVDWVDLWGNSAGNFSGDANACYVVITTIGPGCLSPGVDPLFAKRPYWDDKTVWHEGEYHLKSKLGRWDPRSQTWVTDPADSPCLDRGDPAAAFLDEPSPNGGRINLGAFGGTPEASKSPGGASCREYPEMDFNHDCRVDQADLNLLMQHWLECGLDPNDACWPDGPPGAPNVGP